MNTKMLMVIALGALSCNMSYAQKNKKATTTETPQQPVEEQVTPGAPSEECLVNISLFNESAKNKQYADAAGPWLAAYTECPGANKAIYTRGRNILHWQLSQTLDAAKRDELRNRLMGMYDNRIKYFGNDPKYPTAYILGLKGLDYITFFPEDELKETAYQWLEQSVNGQQEDAEVEVLRQFVVLSANIYKAKPETVEKFISDYLKASDYLDKISKNPEDKNANIAGQVKQGLDILFVQSGAADCNTLDNIYKNQVASRNTDLEYLNQVVSFYKRTGCTESEVYFAASASAHKISPTAESANGCAEMSYKRGDYSQAIKYYEEAVSRTSENTDKADYELKIASLLYKQNSFAAARSHARKSLEYNGAQSTPYMLIATMYASSKPFDDAVLNKTVFWAAVDELVKARNADPSNASKVNELISSYSRHFPTKEEIFFQPELGAGKSFYVGGWIGETTTCR